MIEVSGIEKRFKQVEALKKVDLFIRPSQITGILGPNGCGKTTLIKIILGLVLPDQGAVKFNGQPILGEWAYRRQIGYMPQNAQFPTNLQISELFDMLEELRQESAPHRAELCKRFELGPHLNKPFGHLSGGTRQKVAAIAALMFDPEFLVLDEPTVGLDPVAVLTLKDILNERVKRKGRSILLVSHMVAEIEQLVNTLVFLLEGRVRFSGSLAEVCQRAQTKNLEQAIVSLLKKSPALGARQ